MGIGAVLGGALQGFGNGIAETGRLAEAERREIALENLRNSNDINRLEVSGRIQNDNAAASDKRGFRYGVAKGIADTNNALKRDAGQQNHELTKIDIQNKNEQAMARLQSSLKMTESQTDFAQKAAFEAEQAGTYIKDYQVNEAGEIVGLTATGKVIKTGEKALPKPATGSEGIGAVAAARAASARGGTASEPAPSKAPTAQKKTVTAAQINELAKAKGISVADARKFATENGYVLGK